MIMKKTPKMQHLFLPCSKETSQKSFSPGPNKIFRRITAFIERKHPQLINITYGLRHSLVYPTLLRLGLQLIIASTARRRCLVTQCDAT